MKTMIIERWIIAAAHITAMCRRLARISPLSTFLYQNDLDAIIGYRRATRLTGDHPVPRPCTKSVEACNPRSQRRPTRAAWTLWIKWQWRLSPLSIDKIACCSGWWKIIATHQKMLAWQFKTLQSRTTTTSIRRPISKSIHVAANSSTPSTTAIWNNLPRELLDRRRCKSRQRVIVEFKAAIRWVTPLKSRLSARWRTGEMEKLEAEK